MTKSIKLSLLGTLLAAIVLAITAVSPSVVKGHEGEDHADETVAQANEEETPAEEEASTTPYSYVAQSGDSYTQIARKSVQTYGINNSVNLSLAEVIAAETFLTAEAKFPLLNLGEKVEISADAVKAAIEKAQGLDDAAEARWEKYVDSVDFYTNDVGEPRD